MTAVRPHFVPPPYQDSADCGRVILRDGTTASIRPAGSGDGEALTRFFAHLSPESRRARFSGMALPSADLIAGMCDGADPRQRLTLVVLRTGAEGPSVVAAGSYFATGPGVAEAAFAVDDAFHGRGLGTLLLERLSLIAAAHGFVRFWAVTERGNRAMLDVFRESGFPLRETAEAGGVEIDLTLAPGEASVARTEMRDRVATAASIRPFFAPNGVAVVGASRDPASIGGRILEALVSARFQGPVYPVNPKAPVVGCIRAYPSVRALPEPVDLAIVAVPRDAVPGVVDDCAARGVKALVVVSAGFAETGAEGREAQRALMEKVRGYGMRMVGPNCMGLLNTDPKVRLNASFSPVFPPNGRVAMSSQSGALGLAILSLARKSQLGLSTFVSVGNKADVSGNDLLQYWEEDPQTDVILLYLESFGNPRRFSRIARRVSRRKPIIAVKSGRTGAGKRAAGSHTAALAAGEPAVEALFRQTGVIRAETLDEMFDLAALLGNQPLPKGRRVGVVTNAGGPAILCTDACEAGGLTVPEFSPATRAALRSFLPAAAGTANPVDMIASAPPEMYRRTVEAVLASGEVDALIAIYIPVGFADPDAVMQAVGAGVTAARAGGAAEIPVLACLMSDEGGRTLIPMGERKIPSYGFPENAARALAKAAAYADWRRRPDGVIPDFADMDLRAAGDICRRALAERGSGWLSAAETAELLAKAGLAPVGGFARTADEAAAIASRVGYPVAVKLASTRLVHKTEVGGVRLNLHDEAAVRSAFEGIRNRLSAEGLAGDMDGVVVQPMVAGGVELMVGMAEDPLFGPLVAFGLGGVHVEVLGDVVFRIAPLTDHDAEEMVNSIRGHKLMAGYRGRPAADQEAVRELLLRVSRLAEEVPEIAELDLNPVIALPPGQGCRIVDARIRVAAV